MSENKCPHCGKETRNTFAAHGMYKTRCIGPFCGAEGPVMPTVEEADAAFCCPAYLTKYNYLVNKSAVDYLIQELNGTLYDAQARYEVKAHLRQVIDESKAVEGWANPSQN
jgi:hypothetical protein